MVNFHENSASARHERDTWRHDNERGLALAADGDWAEAIEAFAAAADSLARTLPTDARSAHEPLALVLSNLAQAYFRDGRIDDAMQQAQRACALRVAIAGEDGMPVARARMDLAVMLATAGRLDEATPLVHRAIAAIEHRVGEEDARLAIVLENAARIALAAGNPANAEPLLIRLHALLDAHEFSTSRADQLLARIATVRAAQTAATSSSAGSSAAAAQPAEEIEAPRAPTPPVLSAFDDDVTARIYAHASIAEHEEWEDQPLRDAVAVTDVLLRTTPSGVPIIPATATVEPPHLDLDADAAEKADALLDTMDLTDVLPAPSLRESTADQLLSIDVSTTDSADRVNVSTPADSVAFDLDLAFDDSVVSEDAALSEMAALELTPVEAPIPETAFEAPPASPAGGLSLGFAVEHGMIGDEEELVERPPVSLPVPEALPELTHEPPAPTVVPVTQIVSSGPTNNIAPIADIVQTAPVLDEPAAPASSSVGSAQAPTKGGRTTTPTDERPPRRSSEERVVLPKPEASGGKGKLIGMIVGAIAVAGGAAAFFLLR